MVLVAEWIHFTLFGIILPTMKGKVYTFLGLMNLATKDQCWLGASPVAVSADPRSSSSILLGLGFRVSFRMTLQGFDGIGCYSFWASRFRRTLHTMPFLHCVGVPQ